MIRHKYIIKGQVQGVGFRPFVYKIATQLGLIGFVKNTPMGVEIQIEGDEKSLKRFKILLIADLPVLAQIDSLDVSSIKPLYKGQFEIYNSKQENNADKIASVPPDIAICKECLFDLFSLKKQNNYFKYFATNCTNCGPRYSIIQTVPYDRVNTSMKDFILCHNCKESYTNPLNRRYHAQPTSCQDCGPQLKLIVKNNKYMPTSDIYKDVATLINNGEILAIKGIGGFHIVCDAKNDNTIKKLREFKNRPNKPFAIMCKDITQIKSFAKVSKKEQELLCSKEAPIVILDKKRKKNIVSDLIAVNINKIGCMLPYSAFYHILFKDLQNPIIATSANLGGDPIIIKYEDIINKLPFIDYIVDYNRDIINAIDDSVVQVINNDILMMRLSRGYAPKEIKLPFKINKKVLALGANQKSTISLAFDDKIILSPYIGDLDSLTSVEFLERTIDTFKKFYDFEPDIILCDKHPLYESTKVAKKFKKKNNKVELIQIQHHLAHLFSVKAQHNLSGNFVSFIFDGTGLGDDDTLWGGEIFVNDKRKYHFKPIKLLGGEKAIKEPKRIALSMLFDKYTLDEILSFDILILEHFTKAEIKILYNSWIKNINAPQTSSVGRIFDAVASFSNISHIQTYEAEAAIACETVYNPKIKEYYQYDINDNIIDISIVDFVIKYANIKDKTLYSTMFINTLSEIIIDITQKENLPVILSGGVFQNKILLELVCSKLDSLNINYYYNTTTPINDSGIALGQVWSYLFCNE
jgi:hydrogenase maturation protein HypF